MGEDGRGVEEVARFIVGKGGLARAIGSARDETANPERA
jgi:hypothetical protein